MKNRTTLRSGDMVKAILHNGDIVKGEVVMWNDGGVLLRNTVLQKDGDEFGKFKGVYVLDTVNKTKEFKLDY